MDFDSFRVQTGNYSVKVQCSNCGYSGHVTLKRGIPVGMATCPTCGCSTLSRGMWGSKFDGYYGRESIWDNKLKASGVGGKDARGF